jgi:hypothetical protein
MSKKTTATQSERESLMLRKLPKTEFTWLTTHIERGREEMHSLVATVTPEMAAQALGNNPDNRAWRAPLLSKLTDDIAGGRWQLNGEPIIFSNEGTLNDGQHRLQAVVNADKSIEAWMTFGVPRQSRTSVDSGRARSTGDILSMEGIAYANAVAAVGKLWLMFELGNYSDVDALTREAIHQFVMERRPGLEKVTIRFCGEPFCKAAASSAATPMAVAYLALAKHGFTGDQLEAFFTPAMTGVDLKATSPMLFLRQSMMQARARKSRNWVKLELILRFFLAYRRRARLQKTIVAQGVYPKLDEEEPE